MKKCFSANCLLSLQPQREHRRRGVMRSKYLQNEMEWLQLVSIHEQQAPFREKVTTEIQANICHCDKVLSFAWHTDHTDAAVTGGTSDGRGAPINAVGVACDAPSGRQQARGGSLG